MRYLKILLLSLSSLLFFTGVSLATYEDFTDESWVEADPGGDITKYATYVTATSIQMNLDSWVYKDFGVDHFSTTFTHNVAVELIAISASFYKAWGWAVGNSIDTIDDLTEYIRLQFYRDGSAVYSMTFASDSNTDAMVVSLSTMYYLTIERTGDTDATCKVYDDEAKTNLLDTLVITITAGRKFQYLYALSGNNAAQSTPYSSNNTYNLDINEGAPPAVQTRSQIYTIFQ